MQETVYKEFKCPKLKKAVKLTLSQRDINHDPAPSYVVESCDTALECGVAKHKYITIEYNWSKCPYTRWRF